VSGGLRWCALWVVVCAAASGCAHSRRPTASNLFVKSGRPSVEIGAPMKIPKASRKSRRAVADVRPASSAEVLPTVEARDPQLAAALANLAIIATPEAHRAVAERYRDLGILDVAHDHFLRASQLDPADAAAYEGLARDWRDWGFPQLGLGDASRAVYYAPTSASAHNTLGTLLAAIGHLGEARRAYQRAVQIDPHAAYALNNLCYLSYLEGDVSRARAECRAALEVDPEMTAPRQTLASLDRRGAHDRLP
jgi:tetratricopeptide (TPR) repeat protein